MICIIALIAFSILAIFSASYRPLASEAFDCVFRKMTLRKCKTGLDTRLKTKLVGTLMAKNQFLARLLYKYFEIFSWILVILMFWSIFQSAYGGYNYYTYGNCNGPVSGEFCIFDPTGSASEVSNTIDCEECSDPELVKLNLEAPTNIENMKTYGKIDSNVTFIMIGCYRCNNTSKSYKTVFEIYEEYKDRDKFVFIDIPISKHGNSFEAAIVSNCVVAQNHNKYFEVSDKLYQIDLLNIDLVNLMGSKLVKNEEEYYECLGSEKMKEFINSERKIADEAGIYGT